jgi:hypothetical protein
MSTKQSFTVTLDLPVGATAADAVDYIRTAVMAERGQCHPTDPMSHLARDSVRVRRVAKARPAGAGTVTR